MADLLKDLEAVTLLADKATPGEWRAWDDLDGDYAKVEGSPDGPNIANTGRLGWPEAKDNAAYITALSNLFRTHHAEIAEAVKLAKWYRGLRDSDPDNGEPYIARERQDSWGNWKTEWLGGLDADRALDAKHNSAREDGE